MIDTAAGALDGYRKIATDDTAGVVSTSWGICEAFTDSTKAEATIFAEMAAQGQTVFASSGDSGSENCLANSYDRVSTGKYPVALEADPASPLLLQQLQSTQRQEVDLYTDVARNTDPAIGRSSL